MSFLPKNYSLPDSPSSFFKMQEGENKIRILSDAKIGFEGWKGGKPFRREELVCSIQPEEVDVDTKYGNKPKINLFWAFLVYNYNTKQVEVASITQKTVLKAIENLALDPDWGDPLNYDIAITKSKKGDKTSYSVSPKPAKPLSEEVEKEVKESKLSVDIIFGKTDTIDTSGPIDYPEEEVDASQIPF